MFYLIASFSWHKTWGPFFVRNQNWLFTWEVEFKFSAIYLWNRAQEVLWPLQDCWSLQTFWKYRVGYKNRSIMCLSTMNTWVLCCKGLVREISVRKVKDNNKLLKINNWKVILENLLENKSPMKISFPKISLFRSVYLFYMTIHCSYGIPLILNKAGVKYFSKRILRIWNTCKNGSVRPGSVSSSSSLTLRCLAIARPQFSKV